MPKRKKKKMLSRNKVEKNELAEQDQKRCQKVCIISAKPMRKFFRLCGNKVGSCNKR